jgi:hypothetical protein
MRIRAFNESDGWSHEGPDITSPENLQKIKDTLNSKGSIIVEHWHYRGSTSPSRLIFDDYDEFLTYLNAEGHAGDIVDLWAMHDLCTRENVLLSAKCPDDEGRVPKTGAY